VQLAGGTNRHTVSKLKSIGLLKTVGQTGLSESPSESPYIAGVAYGSYARSILASILEVLEPQSTDSASQAQFSSPLPTMTTSLLSSVTQSSLTQSAIQSATQPATQSMQRVIGLEHNSDLLWQAVNTASALVSDLKGINQADLQQAAFERK
jgi:hypothetical protein